MAKTVSISGLSSGVTVKSVTPDAGGIHVSGSGTKYDVSLDPNTGEERNASVVFKVTDDATATLSVRQLKSPTPTVTPTPASTPAPTPTQTPTQTWYNVVKSATYTRNNCGTGYGGSSVTYTVPAKKYGSTVSQADADAKARADINANGSCTYSGTPAPTPTPTPTKAPTPAPSPAAVPTPTTSG